MARAIADLERDVRALSTEDKQKLLDFLMTELDEPGQEIQDLARQFVAAVERTDRSVKATIDRIDGLDEELERAAGEIRTSVIASDERWPFPIA